MLNRLLLLWCCFLCGCMGTGSSSLWPDLSLIKMPRGFNDLRLVDVGPEEWAETFHRLPLHCDKATDRMFYSTPPGSQIRLVDDQYRHYMGTVMSVDHQRIELVNCVTQEMVAGRDGKRQLRTSHVPYQSLETRSLTEYFVISKPSRDTTAADLVYDSDDVTVDAVVYKNGSRQRWGESLQRDAVAANTDSANPQ